MTRLALAALLALSLSAGPAFAETVAPAAAALSPYAATRPGHNTSSQKS